MATDEMATDRLCAPSGGVRGRSADVGDVDDELLLYLYEKSVDSRTRCFDCVSMGGLTQVVDRDSAETGGGGEREVLSRSTDQICSATPCRVDAANYSDQL